MTWLAPEPEEFCAKCGAPFGYQVDAPAETPTWSCSRCGARFLARVADGTAPRAAFYARRRVRRDKRRRLAKLVRKQARERKAGRRFMRRPTWATMLLFIFAACVVDRERRPCERLQHHDSTGHVVLCDCSCGDDPRFACPLNVVECTRPELLDDEWRWPDESSSEGGSSDGL